MQHKFMSLTYIVTVNNKLNTSYDSCKFCSQLNIVIYNVSGFLFHKKNFMTDIVLLLFI